MSPGASDRRGRVALCTESQMHHLSSHLLHTPKPFRLRVGVKRQKSPPAALSKESEVSLSTGVKEGRKECFSWPCFLLFFAVQVILFFFLA